MCIGIHPGQYFDQETGLHYNLNRYYDPKTGRYLRTDPYGEGLNLYAYVFNNPLNWVDPLGYCAVKKFFTLKGQADFWAGFGDFLTSGFGLTYLFDIPSLTEWIRSQWNEQYWGGEDYINYESGLYTAGAFAGDIVGGTLLGVGVAKVGSKVVKGLKGLKAPKSVEHQRLLNVLHQRELGLDPATKTFRAIEAQVGTRLESQIGRRLSRDLSGAADWVDDLGRTFDAVGPIPSKHFNLQSVTKSISSHLNKQGLDKVVVDLRGLSSSQAAQVSRYISNLPSSQSSRIIVLGK